MSERSSRWTRVGAAATAVLVALWFALGARQAHDVDRATAILDSAPRLTTAQAHHADALLHTAAKLNPDTEVTLLRSQVALASGHRAQALALALSVTRQEPRNPQGWLQVTRTASGEQTVRALYRLIKLAPAVPNTSH